MWNVGHFKTVSLHDYNDCLPTELQMLCQDVYLYNNQLLKVFLPVA